jgi:hypothetical protein
MSEDLKYCAGRSGISDTFESPVDDPAQEEEATVSSSGARLAIGDASVQRTLDPVEDVFCKLLRIVEQLSPFALGCAATSASRSPKRACRRWLLHGKDIFQAEVRHGVGL